jgi:hypothetical protein
MYYLTAVPDSNYFLEQIQVQHYNFIQMNVDMNKVIVVVAYKETPNPKFIDYAHKTNATILFYTDEVPNRRYLALVRPNLFKRFFSDNPHLCNEYFLIHDSDVLLNTVPLYIGMCDGRWHLADTISYIGFNYLSACLPEVLEGMLSLVPELNKDFIQSMESKSGGAQYFSNLNSPQLWTKIETLSISFYELLYPIEQRGISHKETNGAFPEGRNNVQAWTAGMWAELWSFWIFQQDTIIDKELNFSMATYPSIQNMYMNFFHNAGVMLNDTDGHFSKLRYINENMFIADLSYVKETSASYKYVQAVQGTIEYLKSINYDILQ